MVLSPPAIILNRKMRTIAVRRTTPPQVAIEITERVRWPGLATFRMGNWPGCVTALAEGNSCHVK